jgi:hypothetical protein
MLGGFDFVGTELIPEHVEIANARIAASAKKAPVTALTPAIVQDKPKVIQTSLFDLLLQTETTSPHTSSQKSAKKSTSKRQSDTQLTLF